MNPKKKENIGLVYCFSNELYAKEGLHKFGFSQNPFQRKKVQSNAAPPLYPFKDEIIVLTRDYKDFEKDLKKEFKRTHLLLINENNNNSGSEWIQCLSFDRIIEIFKDVLIKYNDAYLCTKGLYLKSQGGVVITLSNRPKCKISLLGLVDGDQIECRENKEKLIIKGEKVVDNGKEETLTMYMKKHFPRNENQNQNYNGFEHFTHKGKLLRDLWLSLTNASPIKE